MNGINTDDRSGRRIAFMKPSAVYWTALLFTISLFGATDATATIGPNVCAVVQAHGSLKNKTVLISGLYIPDYSDPSIIIDTCDNYEITTHSANSHRDKSVESFDREVYANSLSIESGRKYYIVAIARIIFRKETPTLPEALIVKVNTFHPVN